MISSKALIDQTGISRATLNNYIQLGILPKPVVQSLTANADEGGARVLGFFPDDALERVQAVQILKTQGLSMAQVAQRLSETDVLLEVAVTSADSLEKRRVDKVARRSGDSHKTQVTRSDGEITLSLEGLKHPAYMLNYNLELTWLNEAARKEVFGFEIPPARSDQRSLLQLLSRPESRLTLKEQRTLTSLHLQMASARVSYEALQNAISLADVDLLPLLDDIEFAREDSDQTVFETEFFRKDVQGDVAAYRVYAVYFREGILVVHEPSKDPIDDLLNFLGKRDQVIRTLLSSGCQC